MKLSLLLTAALFLIWAFACNNKSGEFIHQKSDTTQVWVLYQNPGTGAGSLDVLYKIIKDTFSVDKTDSTQNVWKRDSIYFYPVPVADTTHIDSVTKRPRVNITYYPLDRRLLIQDLNKKVN